jgi:hypothetical protein
MTRAVTVSNRSIAARGHDRRGRAGHVDRSLSDERRAIAIPNMVGLARAARFTACSALVAGWLFWGSAARAAEPASAPPPATETSADAREGIPNVAYAYTAFGARPRTFGAQAYGLGLGAVGQRAVLGGGVAIWGAPIDRITIIGNAERSFSRDFAPAVAVVGRILGEPGDGWSLGALAKLKVDGFASGPSKDEVESELETGLLLSYAKTWHLDLNAIGGAGMGDDGEVDVEGRLRVGRDIGDVVRVSVDSQARLRLAGPRLLPNKRTYDWSAGPQLLVGSRTFFGALTSGPTTVGLVSDRVGWNAILSIGGSTP